MGRDSGYVLGAVYLYMLQGIKYLLPFLVTPIMTNALGANKFGVLMYWASVLAGLSVLVDTHLQRSGVSQI